MFKFFFWDIWKAYFNFNHKRDVFCWVFALFIEIHFLFEIAQQKCILTKPKLLLFPFPDPLKRHCLTLSIIMCSEGSDFPRTMLVGLFQNVSFIPIYKLFQVLLTTMWEINHGNITQWRPYLLFYVDSQFLMSCLSSGLMSSITLYTDNILLMN